jgi:hypothetical protein
MGVLVGMTIFVPLYFEVVLHLSASQSGLALIPLMGTAVLSSTWTGRLMMHVEHYKRMPLLGLTLAILALGPLAIWPAEIPTALVLLLLTLIGAGIGTVFLSRRVPAERGVASQMGTPPAPPIFPRAVLAAGGGGARRHRARRPGGVAGMSVEMLARSASAHELSSPSASCSCAAAWC